MARGTGATVTVAAAGAVGAARASGVGVAHFFCV